MNNEGLEKSKNALELMNDFNLTMFSNEEKNEEQKYQELEEETCQPIPDKPKGKIDCKHNKNKPCKCEKPQIEQPLKAPTEATNLCSKCNIKKTLIKFRNDPCCNECFIIMMEHKFKYTLRNLLKVLRDDELLIAFSGGVNSVSLLKMLNETLYNPGAKKMFFKVKVVHIDESIIYGEESDIYEETIAKVKDFCSQMKFSLEILKIEEVFLLENQENFLPKLPGQESFIKTHDNRENLKFFIENLSTNGYSKEGMLYVFKLALILAYAKSQKIKKVALADTGQNMACKMLSEIIQGRGIEIQNMIKFLDEKFEKEEILLVKPLRDFLKKEILLYNYIYKLNDFTIIRDNISYNTNNNLPGNGNFNILIDNLLDKLQDQNNATIHTILNTLDKVKPKYDYFDENKFCPICMNQRDKLFNILEIGSLQHTNSNKNDLSLSLEYLPDKSIDETDYYTKLLCFGCRRQVENSKNPNKFFTLLPNFMRKNLAKIELGIEMKEMKKEDKMNEFFLSDKLKY